MNILNTDFKVGNKSKDPRINDIGLDIIKEKEESKLESTEIDENEEYEHEMSLIEDKDIELEQDDFNFIDNISWDTISLEDSFDEEEKAHCHSEMEESGSEDQESVIKK